MNKISNQKSNNLNVNKNSNVFRNRPLIANINNMMTLVDQLMLCT